MDGIVLLVVGLIVAMLIGVGLYFARLNMVPNKYPAINTLADLEGTVWSTSTRLITPFQSNDGQTIQQTLNVGANGAVTVTISGRTAAEAGMRPGPTVSISKTSTGTGWMFHTSDQGDIPTTITPTRMIIYGTKQQIFRRSG